MHLIDEGCHAVDSRIARRDDDHRLSRFGQDESLFGTLSLTLHAGVDTLAARFQIGLNELEIVFVTHYGVCLLDGIRHSWGDVFRTAGTDAGNNNSFHEVRYYK